MRNLFFLMLGIVLVCLLASCRKFQRVVYYRTRQRDITLNMEYPASNPGAKVKLNKGLVEVVIPLGYDYVDQGWTLAVQQRMAPPPLTEIYDVGIKMIKE